MIDVKSRRVKTGNVRAGEYLSITVLDERASSYVNFTGENAYLWTSEGPHLIGNGVTHCIPLRSSLLFRQLLTSHDMAPVRECTRLRWYFNLISSAASGAETGQYELHGTDPRHRGPSRARQFNQWAAACEGRLLDSVFREGSTAVGAVFCS
ncbi:hypothetical protein NML43_23350 [Rhodopseudomonas palustris]|uniref:hypothetical protein n=1 Tax=Rhodopseudomonas palustris TaxID=1076 RepID=UPI0020CB86FC|nr:hypothetical protein [Rhodopseudomonas palustris]MCP9630039.1 hypothetical protein [Rhodopseudomonas palustris]